MRSAWRSWRGMVGPCGSPGRAFSCGRIPIPRSL
ncbi:MAG: hypothetical protein ACLGQX_15425 [Acidobacteriota bacterium]